MTHSRAVCTCADDVNAHVAAASVNTYACTGYGKHMYKWTQHSWQDTACCAAAMVPTPALIITLHAHNFNMMYMNRIPSVYYTPTWTASSFVK